MVDCCKAKKTDQTCTRGSDGKTFRLPRKFSFEDCKKTKGGKGFTMRSSCAPYKDCIGQSRGKSTKKSGKSRRRSTKKSGKSRGRSAKKSGSPRKTKKSFLYNPDDPKKSFDVYIDKNPNDTIPIKYRTYTDTLKTVRKLESLYKKGKYPHKRIFQVAMILMVRLRVLKKQKARAYALACRYYDFIKSRTKIKGEKARKKAVFRV